MIPYKNILDSVNGLYLTAIVAFFGKASFEYSSGKDYIN